MSDQPITCPTCGRVNQLHNGTQDPAATPRDGDVGICWGCRTPYMYAAINGRLAGRVMSAEERAEVMADPHIRAVLGAMTESETPRQALDLLHGGAS